MHKISPTNTVLTVLMLLALTGCGPAEQAAQQAVDQAKQSAQGVIDGAKQAAGDALGLKGEESEGKEGKEAGQNQEEKE